MSTPTLIIYATTDGHTQKIAGVIRDTLESMDHEVDVRNVLEEPVDLTGYDKIIVGSSIRYGYHHKSIVKWIDAHAEELSQRKNAFFSVNLVARKSEKCTPETNPYVRKFLAKIKWKPQLSAVFAGKLDYNIYNWFDAFMIRLIMRMTGGPLETPEPIEFTDWEQVKKFAEEVGRL
ncbi:MAG: menaquinone-dependent protoporphyrinogen IX dehydrogenase [Candidatus Gracilibacteria bacterium]|nr:menaquinone-dependent protoporphyrinogen IX dehydrogenase [Candidatus Gracilibacteria bacterium]